ncbi:flagellar basal body rod protein FlgC [Methylobacterium oxalidis]|uniref:Flagellar basal-body rod protein FlgC n=1 Tax=Methylobacterium oxalidis TaxID=944322 RepID=A0A512IZP3_9HYPH|nr:flagellar basal body rod protein FlgC [Methylobacterium oxalidis]GEP03188.1 flagellar basal-body rod protein FlgC [Methylobacterium oxalidis]GJE30872.1 Flagellar basal-body rod protein FlgC [Methylobacterium oxalidis]GLS67447.1 flagellar basal-body rod protein FlgC [Methylobacterium oxalidis]
MIDPLLSASRLASAGLEAQSLRMRVVSENLANAQSTGEAPGADPYARKTVTFRAELDRALGAASVRVREIGTDTAPFRTEHDPSSPAADPNGNVKLPNVNMLVEMADMREANRSYEANLQVIKQARAMVASVIDLLRT